MVAATPLIALAPFPIPTICGICSLNTHPTDACLTLQEDEPALQAYAVGIFPNKPQPRYDTYSNYAVGNVATQPSQPQAKY